MLLAVVGGWLASVFTAFNTWLCLVRKKWSKFFSFRILEVCTQPALRPVTSILHCLQHAVTECSSWRVAGLSRPRTWWLGLTSSTVLPVILCRSV